MTYGKLIISIDHDFTFHMHNQDLYDFLSMLFGVNCAKNVQLKKIPAQLFHDTFYKNIPIQAF